MSVPQTFHHGHDPGEPTVDAARAATDSAGAAAARGSLAFGAATFLGAFLLFLVQPLIAKFLLPWFGGGPAVWTGCMLFFQVVLLGGYAYAHVGTGRLAPRGQAVLHVALLAAAASALAFFVLNPPAQPRLSAGGSELAPLGQMLLLLAAAVGAPAFVLSATSPLLNAWYARGAPDAGSGVYRLYAVSNAGSLVALVAFPFVVEPALPRRTQLLLFLAGFALFALLCGYCALRAARADAVEASPAPEPAAAGGINFGGRLLWLVLPACASVLLLAVTNTMTHVVAPLPLLWVLPLALYLLSFILAFDARRWYRRSVAGVPLAVAAAGVCWVLLGAMGAAVTPRVVALAAALFVCCMVCHGELAALKPPAGGLTAYYLTIAAGGALGGVLVAVVAPLVLDRYAELHLALWACCALALAAPFVSGRRERRPSGLVAMPSVAGLVILAAVLWAARDPHPVGAGVPVGRWRDFYGVVTLYEQHGADAERANLVLRHGGVTHGRQFLSPEKRRRPTSYYSPRSGAGVALGPPAAPGGAGRRVGVVGLGAGTVAAYGREGDTFRFYELSPRVETIARERFTFLADSAARVEVVAGDGRLSLEREPPQAFDVLLLDAFTGHAVPIHLLTAEAFDTYRRHLKPGGVVVVNVSNTYVDLQPVVAQQAARGGWKALVFSNRGGDERDGVLDADWMVLTDDEGRLEAFRRAGGVLPREDPNLRLWTDEYASLYPVLR